MLVLEKLKVEGESVPIGTGPAGPDFVEGLGSLFAGRVSGCPPARRNIAGRGAS
jgi:hypothetical protein